MTRDRVIVAMLGAVAVLLALNLLRGEPEAQAQQGPPSAAPTVVGGDVTGAGGVDRIYQFWSDGTVDVSVRFYPDSAACETRGGPQGGMCGPVQVIP